jgi:hypothetical protein
MDLQSTILALAAAVCVTVFCGWRGARRWTVIEGPRLIPWRFLMLLAFAASLYLAAYALRLAHIGPEPPR